ncbi:hypothetical protein [Pseudomonas sp. ML96]|uniref:hypothetical protein n=1 Tax=Pseudomonas sp. ML96 TaxID=1523503 RepID=UPI0012E0B628|nr:hypothetical protein [Pseudomonas sp. ML96]
MRRVLALIMMLSLGGCETFKIAMTDKIESQAEKDDVGILQVLKNPKAQNPIWGAGGKILEEHCTQKGEVEALTEAIWVPIVVNLAIKAGGAAASKYVKGVKEKSSKSTKFRAFVTGQTLADARCIVAYRGPLLEMNGEKGPEAEDTAKVVRPKPVYPAAVVVLRVDHHGKAIRFVPIYAYAKNSVSMTKCTSACSSKDAKAGKINMAVAITATAAVPTALQDIRLRELGTATATVKEVPLRGQQPKQLAAVPKPVGAPSDIIAIPEPNVGVQLTVVLSEIGDVAGDPDVAEAEIQAAVESLTVGAEAELKAHYERESED